LSCDYRDALPGIDDDKSSERHTSVSLPNPTGDWQKVRQLLQFEGAAAAEKFLRDNGTERLFDLIDVVREPGYLGQSIAESGLPEETRKRLLVRALKSERDKHQMFARGIVAT
jgi:hypothetical protein